MDGKLIAMISVGSPLLILGIGLLVVASTRGELMTRVFHPRQGPWIPYPDNVVRNLRIIGVLAVVVGTGILVMAFWPAVMGPASPVSQPSPAASSSISAPLTST